MLAEILALVAADKMLEKPMITQKPKAPVIKAIPPKIKPTGTKVQAQILSTASTQANAQLGKTAGVASQKNTGFFSSGSATTLVTVFAIVGGFVVIATALFGANVLRIDGRK